MKTKNLNIAAMSTLGLATAGATTTLAVIPTFGLIPAILTLAVGAMGVISTAVVAKSAGKDAEVDSETAVAELQSSDYIPRDIYSRLVELQDLAKTYRDSDSTLFPDINSVLINAQELFKRIDSKLDSQAGRLAAINYSDTLLKLNKALGVDYYLDIQANPHLWSQPEERLEAVERALKATGLQLIRNIKQINSSQDLEYKISIDLLLKAAEDGNAAELVERRSA